MKVMVERFSFELPYKTKPRVNRAPCTVHEPVRAGWADLNETCAEVKTFTYADIKHTGNETEGAG